MFFSPIRASWWLLDAFRPPEPKNGWFLLCRHDVRRLHEKFSSRRFARDDGCQTHFGILSPKNVWFQLFTHHVRRVHEKFSSRRIDRGDWLLDSFSASWAQKQVIPTLYTWCTTSWLKIFLTPIRASWWLLDSFWHLSLKNKWFLLCRHDVRRVHEKFSSRRFERADGC